MAKTVMVTRTIFTTEVIALCADISAETTCEKTFILSGKHEDKKDVLKSITKANDDENIHIISVKSSEVKECLYGMTEDEFIAHSKVLPPRK